MLIIRKSVQKGVGFMKTKAVIFDKDGTLMDFESFWVTVSRYAISDILEKCSIKNVSADEVLPCLDVEDGIANINGILAQDPYPVMANAIHSRLQKYGCKFTAGEMTEITIDSYHSNVDKGIVKPICNDIIGVFSKLKKLGLILAVVTTDDPYDTKLCLEKLGIIDFFDEIYTDDGIMPPKPDPYCLNAFCEKYGIAKNEVIMVGDTLNDVNFAKRGNVKIIGVAKSKNNRDILSKSADLVMNDISQILDYLD